MQATEYLDYHCPWCDEPGVVAVTRGELIGEWVEDCTVCCSPIVFHCDESIWGDEPLQVYVAREGD